MGLGNITPNNISCCELAGCLDTGATYYDSAAPPSGAQVTPIVVGANNISSVEVPNGTVYGPLSIGIGGATWTDDGSCEYLGCTDQGAENTTYIHSPGTSYDGIFANVDDGTCLFPGCMNSLATNYDPIANSDDGSCTFEGCLDDTMTNYICTQEPSLCIADAASATGLSPDTGLGSFTDDGSCVLDIVGCMVNGATNYDVTANIDGENCIFEDECLDNTALNYWCVAYPALCTNNIPDQQGTFDTVSDCGGTIALPWSTTGLDYSCCGYPGCTNNLATNYSSQAI